VSVAALLDNFISSSSQIEIEEKLKEADLCVRDRLERNPMEPLLIKLAREFTDSQDLSDRLLKLYKVANPNLKHRNP
jgi:pantoate kinase